MKRILLLLVISLVVSCSPKSLGYFEVEPYFKPTINKIDESLYVDFGSHIKDDFAVTQPGMRTLNVTEFKQSLRFACTRTFDHQFRNVEFFAEEQKGFVLKLFKMEPSWWMGEEKMIIRKEFNDTLRYREFGCKINYESTLYYNGEKASDASGEVLVKNDHSQYMTIEKLFQQSVKLACEDMAKKISERKGQ